MSYNQSKIPILADFSFEKDHIIMLASDSAYEFVAQLEDALKFAADSAGYNLQVLDARNYNELQLAQVNGARERGERVIMINPVDPDAVDSILLAAGNMKIVFINIPPDDFSLLNRNAVYVGPDESMAGRLQGEWLAEYFNKRGKKEIKYILLEGPENFSSAGQRTDAALQALADGGIKAEEATPPIVANYDRQEAFQKLLPVLSPGLSFDAIISNNDAMALGAIQALEFLDIDPKKTVIVGIDATQAAIEALRDGKLSMTAFQDANAESEAAIKALTNMLEQKPYNEGIAYPVSRENQYMILIPFELVTANHIPQNLYFANPKHESLSTI